MFFHKLIFLTKKEFVRNVLVTLNVTFLSKVLKILHDFTVNKLEIFLIAA